ncbi:MAG: type II secretion system protein N [Rhizobacter sp.]
MPARLSAFVIWALVAASIAFWGLRLFVRAPGAPAHTVAVGGAAPLRADLTRLFGAPAVAAAAATQAAPAMSARFQLTGVMAPKVAGGPGVALIAVDGKLPRAYRVGAAIDGDLVLQSVSLRSAAIGPVRGTPAVVLEMPPLPVAATGALPPAQSMMSPPAAGAVPPMPVPPTPVAPVAPGAAGLQTVPAMPGMPVMPGSRPVPAERSRGLTPRDRQQSSSTE